MKKYGLYLFYDPGTSLIYDGLGHHLLEFLKASKNTDTKFVIACPNWLVKDLTSLYGNNLKNDFELIYPSNNFFKTIYPTIKFLKKWFNAKFSIRFNPKNSIVISYILSFLFLFPLLVMFLTFFTFRKLNLSTKVELNVIKLKNFKSKKLESKKLYKINKFILRKLFYIVMYVHNNFNKYNLYLLKKIENELLIELINNKNEIKAWYCPTLFWDGVNEIKPPTLICAPDVVVSHFPISFAIYDMERTMFNIKKVINSGNNFVTYSKYVKYETLVKLYNVDTTKIFVIPHGNKILNHLIRLDTNEKENNVTNFCYIKFISILKQKNLRKNFHFDSNVPFIFYASQARPHKNILSLLKAYKYLLTQKYIQYKLILTCDPEVIPSVNDFINTENLKNEVIFLRNLSNEELAICYYLAALAVNPSFSEGGFPFTFSESLSVGTPVLMANIPVTCEVIHESALQNLMLFDPYDWKDISNKILWALQNRDELLNVQKEFYRIYSQRTWKNVVEEYIHLLNKISSTENLQEIYQQKPFELQDHNNYYQPQN